MFNVKIHTLYTTKKVANYTFQSNSKANKFHAIATMSIDPSHKNNMVICSPEEVREIAPSLGENMYRFAKDFAIYLL